MSFGISSTLDPINSGDGNAIATAAGCVCIIIAILSFNNCVIRLPMYILLSFIGNIEQQPSKFSAIKINGKRAYDLARKGEEFIMPKRNVAIYSLTLINNSQKEGWFKVSCSKGTYIRTLSHDICRKLGVCGYVSFLRRLKVGDFALDTTISLDWLKYDITNKLIDV